VSPVSSIVSISLEYVPPLGSQLLLDLLATLRRLRDDCWTRNARQGNLRGLTSESIISTHDLVKRYRCVL
jgi:hypothetical protein